MRIAIIGGSGIEDRLLAGGLVESVRSQSVSTPFGAPSSPILSSRVRGAGGASGGVEVLALKRHGEGHAIPPHRVPYRANIFALKALGATHIVATGAVGSLRETIRPGEVVLCDQFIDRTTGAGTRGGERTFFDSAAVHVDFADPCCPVMRGWLLAAAGRGGSGGGPTKVHGAGTYVTIDGPTFSTRAESRMHRAMGADVVGMTALPEARLAREAEMAYTLLALPTDFDCWMERAGPGGGAGSGVSGGGSVLEELLGNLERSADAAAGVIAAALADASVLAEASPAHRALERAVWTKRERISEEEARRLAPVWGRVVR